MKFGREKMPKRGSLLKEKIGKLISQCGAYCSSLSSTLRYPTRQRKKGREWEQRAKRDLQGGLAGHSKAVSEWSGGNFVDNISTYVPELFWVLHEIVHSCLAQCLAHNISLSTHSIYFSSEQKESGTYQLGKEKGRRNCRVPLGGLCLLCNAQGGVGVQ